MIRVYTVKNKELFETDVHSKKGMDNIVAKVKRAWVDCTDLDEKEIRIVSDLLGVEATTLNGIENGKIRPHYAKCFDEMCPYYTWISTPVVEFTDELELHPFSIILKERFLEHCVASIPKGLSNQLSEHLMRCRPGKESPP